MLQGSLLTPLQAEAALRSTAPAFVPPGLFAREAADFLRSGVAGSEFVAATRMLVTQV
jgi:hypothetical protein